MRPRLHVNRSASHDNAHPFVINVLVNFRSVKNIIAELAGLLSLSPDVVIGPKSWLHDAIIISEVFPTEYVMYRKDRNAHGGGEFTLVRKLIPNFFIGYADFCKSVWRNLVLQLVRIS